jgi:LPXTG-motif cell wall-anchored protein
MKRSIFSILVALTLMVAAPVLAQQKNLAENEAQQESNDNRTNPNAGSIAGQSGLTITGTVEKWDDHQITLKTDTGIHPVQVVPNTDWDHDLTVGEAVSIDYTRTSQGVMIASLVRSQGQETMGAESTVATTTTTSSAHTEMDMDTDMEADADVDVDTTWKDDGMNTDVTASADLDDDNDADLSADVDTTLPSTGSKMPLLGLLGLLSLVAAVGVRSAFR